MVVIASRAMEKTVKGATKIKLAAPKAKYVASILAVTRTGESGVADIFRTLQYRLRDSTWTIVFKGLIIVHLMIREGEQEVTLKYIAESPKRMAISSFTEGQTQGLMIRRYYEYLLTRVKAYRDCKQDHVKTGTKRMKNMTVDKGLLRQIESVQDQIKALLQCDMLGGPDPENEISITAFRLLTLDLLELFKVMNEGTINMLEHYFEMSKPDAERALAIYKYFGKQTDQVVQYLSIARQYELYTKLEVPKLKHAPTTLTSSLQDYVNDPDFEINRRQYLAQQEAKRSGKPAGAQQGSSAPVAKSATTTTSPAGNPTLPSAQSTAKGPAPDLIDFFGSIEQNQQPMAQNLPQQQQTQFQSPSFTQQQFLPQPAPQQAPQVTGYNPFMQQPFQTQIPPQPLQQNFTGAGFGGYGPQPAQPGSGLGFASGLSTIPQDSIASFQPQPSQQPQQQPDYQQYAQALQPQQTSTNPFRQSMMPTAQNTASPTATALHRQSTNPFAKSTLGFNPGEQINTLGSISPSPPPQPHQAQQLQPQRTGTNPFAKPQAPSSLSPLTVNVTGSTNPFRQSQFVNQATGQGWQQGTQGTFAGYDMNNVNTIPVFPRPGQN